MPAAIGDPAELLWDPGGRGHPAGPPRSGGRAARSDDPCPPGAAARCGAGRRRRSRAASRATAPADRAPSARPAAPRRSVGPPGPMWRSASEGVWSSGRPRPAGPSSRSRRTHLWPVARLIPWASAAVATVQPAPSTRSIRSRRPNGLSRAVRCATRASSPFGASTPHTVTGGSHLSTTSLVTTARARRPLASASE